MPTRIDLFSALRTVNSSSCRHVTQQRLFSTTQVSQASKAAEKKRKHQDPYAIAQSKARRAANVSRQAALQTERSKALGDPVRGINTAFVQSFDTALNLQDDVPDTGIESSPSATQTERLNHFVSAEQLKQTLEQSRDLTTPIRSQLQDPAAFDDKVSQQKQDHTNAVEALSRIVALENASAKDRLRVNIQRCIETFGRHNTDKTLKPKPSMVAEDAKTALRIGPDTGSSEVQAAILTAKIRGLANFLETRGKKDMANKRNLRLLVHKRQKHLAYLRRKERGGERWQNLIATLGLTEGTWRGEITL